MKSQAILLAAGQSSRFETGNKLLHLFNGKPLIHHSIETLLSTSIDKIIVVTGSPAFGIESSITKHYPSSKVHFVSNPEFKHGMASSIKSGLKIASTNSNCLICLGDMPLVKTATIEALLNAGDSDSTDVICVPVHLGKSGNPVLFKPPSFSALARLSGDKGARQFILQNSDKIHYVDVNDSGVHRDFDTVSDFDTTSDFDKFTNCDNAS